eukprot:scaffold15752_cov17-Tisochrysis_lutea.AAC.1
MNASCRCMPTVTTACCITRGKANDVKTMSMAVLRCERHASAFPHEQENQLDDRWWWCLRSSTHLAPGAKYSAASSACSRSATAAYVGGNQDSGSSIASCWSASEGPPSADVAAAASASCCCRCAELHAALRICAHTWKGVHRVSAMWYRRGRGIQPQLLAAAAARSSRQLLVSAHMSVGAPEWMMCTKKWAEGGRAHYATLRLSCMLMS